MGMLWTSRTERLLRESEDYWYERAVKAEVKLDSVAEELSYWDSLGPHGAREIMSTSGSVLIRIKRHIQPEGAAS